MLENIVNLRIWEPFLREKAIRSGGLVMLSRISMRVCPSDASVAGIGCSVLQMGMKAMNVFSGQERVSANQTLFPSDNENIANHTRNAIDKDCWWGCLAGPLGCAIAAFACGVAEDAEAVEKYYSSSTVSP